MAARGPFTCVEALPVPMLDTQALAFWDECLKKLGSAGRQLATIPEVISAVLYQCQKASTLV